MRKILLNIISEMMSCFTVQIPSLIRNSLWGDHICSFGSLVMIKKVTLDWRTQNKVPIEPIWTLSGRMIMLKVNLIGDNSSATSSFKAKKTTNKGNFLNVSLKDYTYCNLMRTKMCLKWYDTHCISRSH